MIQFHPSQAIRNSLEHHFRGVALILATGLADVMRQQQKPDASVRRWLQILAKNYLELLARRFGRSDALKEAKEQVHDEQKTNDPLAQLL